MTRSISILNPWALAVLSSSLFFTGAAFADTVVLKAAVNSEFRATDSARDRYRHPLETLEFFGVKPHHTVIEISPGGGWYSKVLGPYLQPAGQLIAASFPHDAKPAFRGRMGRKFEALVAGSPGQFSTTTIVHFYPPANPSMGEGVADVVLTFRNTHNWINDDVEKAVFAAAFAALKPGGVFGVVQHRAASKANVVSAAGTGYVPEFYVKRLAREAGFVLDGESEINGNVADLKNHPEGVWTLPPGLRLGEKDKAKYVAIGESDRMTLRFRKPLK